MKVLRTKPQFSSRAASALNYRTISLAPGLRHITIFFFCFLSVISMCTHVCAGVCTHVYACRGQMRMPGVLLSHSKTECCTEPRLSVLWLGRLASRPHQSPVSVSLAPYMTTSSYCVGLGDLIRSACSQPLSHLSSPHDP